MSWINLGSQQPIIESNILTPFSLVTKTTFLDSFFNNGLSVYFILYIKITKQMLYVTHWMGFVNRHILLDLI